MESDSQEQKVKRYPESHLGIGGWDTEVIKNVKWVDNLEQNDFWAFPLEEFRVGKLAATKMMEINEASEILDEDFFMTLVTGVDAIIIDYDLDFIKQMIVSESDGKCNYGPGYVINCDCSKGIDSTFKPLVFTTKTADDEPLDLVI